MLWTHIIWEVLGHSDYAIFGNAPVAVTEGSRVRY